MITYEELQETVDKADHGSEGEVNEEEFLRTMNSRAHCTAERQCNVAEGPPVGPGTPKDMKRRCLRK